MKEYGDVYVIEGDFGVIRVTSSQPSLNIQGYADDLDPRPPRLRNPDTLLLREDAVPGEVD